MKTNYIHKSGVLVLLILLSFSGCKAPEISFKEADLPLPEQFTPEMADSASVALINWREYFNDEQLSLLIDTALKNNLELNIILQEIAVSQSEVLEKEGEYQPFVDIGLGAGTEKVGRFTRNGAVESSLDIVQGKEFPEPLGDLGLGIRASWEVDIWHKLRNAKDAAQLRYLAATEGRNFLVTQLISEIADAYYELMALDNLLDIINRNVTIQGEALVKMRSLKENAKATQLAVNRFEAQLLNTKNQQYAILQKITETENRLYFLTGKFPSTVSRNSASLMQLEIDSLQAGLPAQLLENRPDIRQAVYQMEAAQLDVKSAKANFYPKLDLSLGVGYNAFNPTYLFRPESLIFNAAGDLMAPLINRKAIQAQFNRASAEQIKSVYAYQEVILRAYTDVLNQMKKLENYSVSLQTKEEEVDVLNRSVEIANSLFRYAKADYVEVLLTQEEVLDAQMELVETKLMQVHAKVQLYNALGGGW